MREITPAELLGQLRSEIELIAAPAADQERWLIDHKYPADEMALQLDDSILTFLPRLRHEGLMPARLDAALRALDAHFESFSGSSNAVRWTEEALYHDPAWAQARQLARPILDLIDSAAGSPPDTAVAPVSARDSVRARHAPAPADFGTDPHDH